MPGLKKKHFESLKMALRIVCTLIVVVVVVVGQTDQQELLQHQGLIPSDKVRPCPQYPLSPTPLLNLPPLC